MICKERDGKLGINSDRGNNYVYVTRGTNYS